MFYELIIHKNVSTLEKEKDEYNKSEVITVFHSMIQNNASTKYPLYHLYEDTFYKFANEVTKIGKIINHKHDVNFPEPLFMEDDKKILVKPKTKTTTISEMFNKIHKSNELKN
jgi:hypothetical protein